MGCSGYNYMGNPEINIIINMAEFNLFKPSTWVRPKAVDEIKQADTTGIPPGRVSQPDVGSSGMLATVRGLTSRMVTPSFRTDLIPLIRDLYKINPDVGVALQDMFKLANTGHYVQFPNNSDEEEIKMIKHLQEATKRWSTYTAGIDGLVNKFITQCLIGGAVSIEAVPNKELRGIETVLFLKPETIIFKRQASGKYHPYQRVTYTHITALQKPLIRLNTETYLYAGMFNDTDEPYGVPPFMSALDSLNAQHTMRNNMFNIMEKMGLYGFLEALMAKPDRLANESEKAYQNRLSMYLTQMKRNLLDGMSDGIVTGYIDDHEFKLNSTTANLSNVEKPWHMNEQQVANGLGVNPSIISAENQHRSEGGTGVMLSKMISQLRNIQMIVEYTLVFLYNLELRLAGFNNKGIKVRFRTSTISDEVKIQQAEEYKIRNIRAKFDHGWISQTDAAREAGYDKPDQKEPRAAADGTTPEDAAAKQQREASKDTSDRKTRDKNNPSPKRNDQKTQPR